MLYDHQDSLSETDTEKGNHKEERNRIEKKKTSEAKEKGNLKFKRAQKRDPSKENKDNPAQQDKTKPPRLYPSLEEEFATLNVQEEDDSLTEEGQSEKKAERYKEERYSPPPPYVTSPSVPNKGRDMERKCHFLSPKVRSQLASAFPVFQDPASGQRFHEQIPYKQLKDLVEATRTYGVSANYTRALLSQLSGQALTPSDWAEIAKACLTTGQYLDFKSVVFKAAHDHG